MDAGSVTLELAILAPAVLVLLGLIVVAGRVGIADGAVQQASAAAARDASLARTSSAARTAATAAATDALAQGGLHCASVTVRVDTGGFATRVGRSAQVSATVTCTLSLSGMGVPGVPLTTTLESSTTSVLDTYRTR